MRQRLQVTIPAVVLMVYLGMTKQSMTGHWAIDGAFIGLLAFAVNLALDRPALGIAAIAATGVAALGYGFWSARWQTATSAEFSVEAPGRPTQRTRSAKVGLASVSVDGWSWEPWYGMRDLYGVLRLRIEGAPQAQPLDREKAVEATIAPLYGKKMARRPIDFAGRSAMEFDCDAFRNEEKTLLVRAFSAAPTSSTSSMRAGEG